MNKKTYHIITIGCQMNKSDSERIAGVFEELGFTESVERKLAHFVVLTTCGVRQAAEDRAVGLVARIKKENKNARIILAGCLSEREDVIKKLKDMVDIWLPARGICDLRFAICDLDKEETRNKKQETKKNQNTKSKSLRANHQNHDYLNILPKYSSSFSAFVPIGNGCDNFCTYCVVPYARGREVYRLADEIVSEVEELVRRGYKEITLIAQNVNSYFSPDASSCHSREGGNPESSIKPWIPAYAGMTREGSANFANLLRVINFIPGDFWIRFATSHPKDMSDDLIAAINDCEKVCKHIHLPAQAGDNHVLERMNRKYTIEHYIKLIEKIRSQIINNQYSISNDDWQAPVALTTDVIVGFPGETREQFLNTVGLFEKVKYDMAYIAQYSPRPGTAAKKMEDDVLQTEKKQREHELTEVLRKTALENNQAYFGKIVKVLVEGQNKKGELISRTGTNKTVKFSGDKNLIGNFVNIKIEKVRDFGLNG